MGKNELFFYGELAQERYCQMSLNDGVTEYVEGYDSTDPMPEKIIIVKMSPEEIPVSRFRFLDVFLEGLDDEFSDPDGDTTKPTQAMKDAEAAFVAVMRGEYRNHWLRVVEKIEVDLKGWCRENGYIEEWEANR